MEFPEVAVAVGSADWTGALRPSPETRLREEAIAPASPCGPCAASMIASSNDGFLPEVLRPPALPAADESCRRIAANAADVG